jgi:Tol biopolymer transport system component
MMLVAARTQRTPSPRRTPLGLRAALPTAVRPPTASAIRRLAALLALLGALVCCAPARALFTASVLVSGDPALQLQADYGYDPAISADGRYVAFSGSVASLPGVWRKDLANGRLELVAAGEHTGAPSISADGRYLSFTTNDEPATGHPTGEPCSGVYVRDMDEPIDAPGAFTLASARDGSPQSLTYQPPAPGQSPYCGAAAAARVALSADGRRVAFTVLSPSDLAGICSSQGQPPALACTTPPDQVAVRDLAAHTTTLVSVTRASLGGAPQPVPNGAALSGVTYAPSVSLRSGGASDLALSASTAALSADGSTVAWMGVDVAEQAQIDQPPPTEGHTDGYAEPLWRRIGDGPGAPTRRILSGADASAPGCPPACPGGLDLDWDTQGISPQEYTGAAPEFGSYTSRASVGTGFASGNGFGDTLGAVTPQLSADGMTVALLSTQPDYGHDPNFGLLDQTRPPPANAFVVHMAPGLTRAQAIVRLTDWASLNFTDAALSSPVTSVALSPDGSRIAFTTERIAFPLAPPALVTPPLSAAGATQLYEVNLAAGTLALVSQGYDGQPADDGVFAAALSENGERLALASAAGNLVYGVVNQGSDVYATEEIDSPAVLGTQSLTPLPPLPGVEISWSLSASSAPSPDGTLLVYVSAPGAGALSASAVAAVSARASTVRPRRRARHATRHAARRALTARRRGPTRARRGRPAPPANPQIAHASAGVTGPGYVELHLIPAARYRSLLAGRGGLYATITVTFTAPGHPRLTLTLHASFPRRPAIYDLPRPGYPLPKHGRPHRRKHRGRRR